MRAVAISGCLVITLPRSHDDVSVQVRRQKQRISNASANPELAVRHRGPGFNIVALATRASTNAYHTQQKRAQKAENRQQHCSFDL